jgi:hypothetical protein
MKQLATLYSVSTIVATAMTVWSMHAGLGREMTLVWAGITSLFGLISVACHFRAN